MFDDHDNHILEADSLRAFDPPIELSRPAVYDHGLVFASPHSGRIYPESFVKQSRLSELALRRNEDALMDEIIAPIKHHDIPVLKANFPRCFVDVNRGPHEILPAWRNDQSKTASTQRAAAGLGVIPTMISEKIAIYKQTPGAEIVEARLNQLYFPYHNALSQLLDRARHNHAHALLIDCHSMPSTSVSGHTRADIILGDRFGASAHPDYVAEVEEHFKSHGYRVIRNYPYAGGFVTSHYGRPENNTHVIQIEVNRGIYVNQAKYKPLKGFNTLQDCFESLAVKLKYRMSGQSRMAAE